MTRPTELYHATLSANVPAILRQGIRPQKKGVWVGGAGQELRLPGYIYACDRFDDAARWAFRTGYHLSQPAQVVVFVDSLASWELDPHWQGQLGKGRWLRKKGGVPPGAIIEAVLVTPELTHKLVRTLGERTQVLWSGRVVPLKNPDALGRPKLGDIMIPADVAEAWEGWCGITPWSQLLRRFGELGGKVRWWCGYPQSASAIPLAFTLVMPDGSEFNGHSRLKDLKAAVAVLESGLALNPPRLESYPTVADIPGAVFLSGYQVWAKKVNREQAARLASARGWRVFRYAGSDLMVTDQTPDVEHARLLAAKMFRQNPPPVGAAFGRSWRLLARHNRWVSGASISEFINVEDSGLRRFTATIRGYRNWQLGVHRVGPDTGRKVQAAVLRLRDRIDAGDESVFA